MGSDLSAEDRRRLREVVRYRGAVGIAARVVGSARSGTVVDGVLHCYRKVVRIGSSLAVSLPASWIRKYGVKPGDVLAVVAGGGILSMKLMPGVEASE